MGKWTHAGASILAILLIAGSMAAGLGCSGLRVASPGPAYEYFSQPDAGDAWSRKIRGWQIRQMAAHTAAGRDTSRSLDVGRGGESEFFGPAVAIDFLLLRLVFGGGKAQHFHDGQAVAALHFLAFSRSPRLE